MTNEAEGISLEQIKKDRDIDGFFGRLAKGETPKVEELDIEYLRQILTDAGANLNPENREAVIESLGEAKYSKVNPDRRPGLNAVFGVEPVAEYEKWALENSVSKCARAVFKGPIPGSEDRGLKLMLADLVEGLVGGKRTMADFVRRTDVRVRFGKVYADMKKIKADLGIGSEEYRTAKEKYEAMDHAKETKGLYMIPVGSLQTFWNSVRSGHLPK